MILISPSLVNLLCSSYMLNNEKNLQETQQNVHKRNAVIPINGIIIISNISTMYLSKMSLFIILFYITNKIDKIFLLQ
jgi:hypothetical protein